MHPGVHPHSDRPNWRPAETFDDYISNCREGSESYTDVRAAKLLGDSRVKLYRARLMAQLPDDLFDRLLIAARKKAGGKFSSKIFANIAIALANGGNIGSSCECCPHCGETIRKRPNVPQWAADEVNAWLDNQEEAYV